MKMIQALVDASGGTRCKDFSHYGIGKVFCNAFTVADREKIARHNEKKEQKHSFFVYAIVFKAMDEKGDPIFTLEDVKTLREKVDEEIITDIGSFIIFGEPEKN